jgi:hypothetical protein
MYFKCRLQSLISIFLPLTVALSVFTPSVAAKEMFAPYVGTGLAPTSNAGIALLFTDNYGMDIGYSQGNIAKSCSAFSLKLKHAAITLRPFSGSFYLGAGGAMEDLSVSNIYAATNQEFTMTAKATLFSSRVGWLWGIADGGLWWGFDVARYQSLSSSHEVDAPGVDINSAEYKNAYDNITIFAESEFYTFMVRVGWMI